MDPTTRRESRSILETDAAKARVTKIWWFRETTMSVGASGTAIWNATVPWGWAGRSLAATPWAPAGAASSAVAGGPDGNVAILGGGWWIRGGRWAHRCKKRSRPAANPADRASRHGTPKVRRQRR